MRLFEVVALKGIAAKRWQRYVETLGFEAHGPFSRLQSDRSASSSMRAMWGWPVGSRHRKWSSSKLFRPRKGIALPKSSPLEGECLEIHAREGVPDY